MLTIFACPRGFSGKHAVIQRNAVLSWTRLMPKAEVILCCDDPGTAGLCRELGLKHLPDIARSPQGTPLVNDIFLKAQEAAAGDLLCYINSDIILTGDFMPAVGRLQGLFPRFMATGARWDIAPGKAIDFGWADWEQELRREVSARSIFRDLAPDYFVFPRGIYDGMPPFAIGRLAFDSWLIWRAVRSGLPVVDMTASVLAVHQGIRSPSEIDAYYAMPEVKNNIRLAGRWAASHNLYDTTYELTLSGVRWTPFRKFKNRAGYFSGRARQWAGDALRKLGLKRR